MELNSFELYSIHQIDISKLQIYFRVGATLLRLRSTLSGAGSSLLSSTLLRAGGAYLAASQLINYALYGRRATLQSIRQKL